MRSSCSASTCSTRSTMEADHRRGDDVPAWFLDTDYNGLCFHVSPGVLPAHERLGQPQEGAQGRLRRKRLGPSGRHDQRAVRGGRARADRREGDRRPGQRVAGGEEPRTEATSDEQLTKSREPILNSPFEEPTEHWYIRKARSPEQRTGRRPAVVLSAAIRRPRRWTTDRRRGHPEYRRYELALVNLIRERVEAWRAAGLSRRHAHDAGTAAMVEARRPASKRLFFAQLEAAETVIFLTEARADFLPGHRRPARRAERRTARPRASPASAATPARWRRAPARRPSWGCWPPGASSTRSTIAATRASPTSCWSSAPT